VTSMYAAQATPGRHADSISVGASLIEREEEVQVA